MRIASIKFLKHQILEGLELDFTKNGEPVPTIIIAGENGAGKTCVLNSIYSLMKFRPNSLPVGESVTYEVYLSPEEMTFVKFRAKSTIRRDIVFENQLKIIVAEGPTNSWNRIKIYGYTTDGADVELQVTTLTDLTTLKMFRSLYSTVAVDFLPQGIASVTSANLDQQAESQMTGGNTAKEITQLLIDIQALDDADIGQWVKANPGIAPDLSVLNKRISRFSEAFTLIFKDKEYKEVRNQANAKKVVFTENGKDVNIESLSSGEKQIVFRGGFFLKDVAATKSNISLIDEPEISLHPDWQLKILAFYKTILDIEKKDNHSQLIVATHSPFILHNDSRSNDKIIVLQKDDAGNVRVKNQSNFYKWNPATSIKEAFNLSLFTDKKPMVLVEGETDEKYFKAAAEALGIDLKGIIFQWVGRLNDKGHAEHTGDKSLNNTAAFLKANPQVCTNSIMLLYDCDTNKPDEDHEGLYIRKLPLQEGALMKCGIENLLVLPENFDVSPFKDKQTTKDGYGMNKTIEKLNKQDLCNYLIANGKTPMLKGVFKNFEFTLNMIINTLT